MTTTGLMARMAERRRSAMTTTIDPTCVIAVVLAVIGLAMLALFLRGGRDDDGQVTIERPPQEPDPCDGAARELAADTRTTAQKYEIPTVNGWSAAITGQMVYGPAPTATKFKPPKTHCALCIIETCDEWGIPLAEVRTIGRQKLCKRHRRFDLASAGRGA